MLNLRRERYPEKRDIQFLVCVSHFRCETQLNLHNRNTDVIITAHCIELKLKLSESERIWQRRARLTTALSSVYSSCLLLAHTFAAHSQQPMTCGTATQRSPPFKTVWDERITSSQWARICVQST